jgi:hypothetical protein
MCDFSFPEDHYWQFMACIINCGDRRDSLFVVILNVAVSRLAAFSGPGDKSSPNEFPMSFVDVYQSFWRNSVNRFLHQRIQPHDLVRSD